MFGTTRGNWIQFIARWKMHGLLWPLWWIILLPRLSNHFLSTIFSMTLNQMSHLQLRRPRTISWKTTFSILNFLQWKCRVHASAIIADDAEVDLSAWALIGEILEQRHALPVLYQFLVKWQPLNPEMKTRAWLYDTQKDMHDPLVIDRCLAWAKRVSLELSY